MLDKQHNKQAHISDLEGGQLDGHVIEQCVRAGDGQFKEGAWVRISEEYQNHPERQQLARFVGKYGRLTRRYHGSDFPT